MDLSIAMEMAGALTLDNEHGISTLGSEGDAVAELLLAEIERLSKVEYVPRKFSELPKGARFKYPGGDVEWVVIDTYGHGLVAKWEGLTSGRFQTLCCFTDDKDWHLGSEVLAIC